MGSFVRGNCPRNNTKPKSDRQSNLLPVWHMQVVENDRGICGEVEVGKGGERYVALVVDACTFDDRTPQPIEVKKVSERGWGGGRMRTHIQRRCNT